MAYYNGQKVIQAVRVVEGGGSSTGTVRYDVSQDLTNQEKGQARANIGAAEQGFIYAGYNSTDEDPSPMIIEDYICGNAVTFLLGTDKGEEGDYYLTFPLETGDLITERKVNLKLSKDKFGTKAYVKAINKSLDKLFIEYFNDASGLDETDPTTQSVIDSYYNAENMQLEYNDTQKTIKTKTFTLDSNFSYIWLYYDADDSNGSISFDVIVGTKRYSNFANENKEYIFANRQSTNVSAEITISGEVDLKNIAWGVEY